MLARCKKTFALISLVACSFHAGNLMALGLGELTVNSSLNEPLDATIQVLGLDGLTENQIQASLGSLQDFQRANIPRVGLIDAITLEIDIFNREEGILRLTTDEPVVEPFLNMVISVRWPNGRLMRDYTALIDLPVFFSDEPQATPVNIPETPAPAPQQEETASRLMADDGGPEAPVAAPSPPVSGPAPQPGNRAATDEVVIESGDNLYDIAAANRPSGNVSVEQTMLAIQRANPDAFIDNNINRIRVGRVLRIPSLQEIQSIDQSQAVNQIALQNQATSTQPLAFTSNSGAGSQQGADELTILSGEDGTANLTGDSDLAATIAALENQLALSEENLDRARLENQELRTRFAALEEQVEILQNIIAMQDARLAQLQADLAAAGQAEPEPAAATETPAQPVPAPVQQPVQDNSLMGQISSIFENTLVLATSLVGLIVLVVGFLVWRRRAAQDDMEEFAVAGGGAQATYTADEPEGASAGFMAALKARFSSSEDDDDDDVAVADKEDDDLDDEEDGGLLAKLKGIFSRSDHDDDDGFDDGFDDDIDDDVDDDVDDDEEDELDDDDDSSEAPDDDDDLEEDEEEDEDGEITAVAEEEFDFDFGDEVEEDEEDDVETPVTAATDDTDEDDLDLGNLGDLDIDDVAETAAETETVAAVGEDEILDTFDFGLDAAGDTDEAEEGGEESVESFDFTLDESPKGAAVTATDDEADEVESFEFSVSEAPKAEATAADDAGNDGDDGFDEEVEEKFEFDVASVSSFGEKASAEPDSTDEDEVETFAFDTGSDGTDPLAAALNEVDAEAGSTDADDDEFDLGDIEIDDSLFDASDDSDATAGTGGGRDESSTKLDLAVAYEAMGDLDGAREILNEVVAEGNDAQVTQAKELLEKWNLV